MRAYLKRTAVENGIFIGDVHCDAIHEIFRSVYRRVPLHSRPETLADFSGYEASQVADELRGVLRACGFRERLIRGYSDAVNTLTMVINACSSHSGRLFYTEE